MTDPRDPSAQPVPGTDPDPTVQFQPSDHRPPAAPPTGGEDADATTQFRAGDPEETTVLRPATGPQYPTPQQPYAAPQSTAGPSSQQFGTPPQGQPWTGTPGAQPPQTTAMPPVADDHTVNLGAVPGWSVQDILPTPEAEPGTDQDEPPTDPSAKSRPGWLIPAIVAGAIVLLLGGAYVFDLIRTSGQIEAGTTIGHVEVGGLTPEEAIARLTEQTAELRAPIAITSHDAALTLEPTAAGLAFDIETSVAAAGTRSANPVDRVSALFGTTSDLPLIATVDDAALTSQLQQIAASTNVAPVEGSVTLTGTEVAVVQPVVGRDLDVAAATDQIRSAWLSGNPNSLTGAALPATEVPVRADPAKTEAAATEIRAVLSGPLTVTAGATSFEVPVQTLATVVTVAPDDADGFTVTVDEAAIGAGMAGQLAAVETQPADASVAIVNGAPAVTPGVDGMSLDAAATSAALSTALRDPAHALTAVYTVTPPEVTTAAIEALGIKEVVSEFTTGGFAWDSGQNVKFAAAEVDGAIVFPDETFSLNGHTGPRTEAEGYIGAGIIQDGVPSRAVGGGISQFATTLFNASYFAGMEDIEHKAHSYYISRYPEGREATVFQDTAGNSIIDVKFKNNFDTAVLIETIWTENDITVRFWGTKTVEIESITGERYNFTSAPTKTIPYGQPCSPTNGSGGFSVDNTRMVRDLTGAEVDRTTSTTVYNGQQRTVCEPAPPTPEPTPDPAAPVDPGATPPADPAPPAG